MAGKSGGKSGGKQPPLGSGKRFEAVQRSAAASGARDPAAVAAAIGRAKYGDARMQQLAAKGRARAAKGK